MTPNKTAPDLAQFASLFIVKPSSLGDIVHTLPAVSLLKQAHPHLSIRWISNPEWTPLLHGNPDLTEVITFPRKEFRGIGGAAKFFLWSRTLNATARDLPELTLDFQGLLRSALISKARGSDPIIGMSDAREGASLLHDQVVTVNPGAHAVDRNLEIPRHLGIESSPDLLRFHLPTGDRPQRTDLPAEYLLIHPTSRGEGKSLSNEALQTLCDCLAPRPVIIVGRQENPPELRGNHILSLLNQTTLPELLWLIHHAKACLSVDSGPMHLAAAAGIPTLGIHTWSDPRKVGPYQATTAQVWKAGRIATRHEFSDTEAATHKQVESNDARRMADFLLKRWELTSNSPDQNPTATRSL